MAISKAQQAAVQKYVKSNYDRVELKLPRGYRARIQDAADRSGQSSTAYIKSLIDKALEQDLHAD